MQGFLRLIQFLTCTQAHELRTRAGIHNNNYSTAVTGFTVPQSLYPLCYRPFDDSSLNLVFKDVFAVRNRTSNTEGKQRSSGGLSMTRGLGAGIVLIALFFASVQVMTQMARSSCVGLCTGQQHQHRGKDMQNVTERKYFHVSKPNCW